MDVDTTQPRAILERKVRSDDTAAESTIVLLICFIEERDLTSAKALLLETRDRFAAIGQVEVWKFWVDQISAMNAEGEFGGAAASNHPFHKTALRAHLRTTRDAEPLLEYLAAEHAAGKAEATFELCAVYVELGRWTEGLPLVETLLERVQTTEALRIACTVLYRNSEYAKCAKTIEENRSRFPASQLPQSFLQMKIGAQERSGEVISAIRSAEDALAVEANRVNFLNLANLYLESGDFMGLTQLASRHERFPDLSNEEVLRLSARLATVNQTVGVSLWKRAVKFGVSDDQVGAVVSIGFNLGLDIELGEFMQRMAALPEEKGFQRIDLQQLIDLAASRNEAANTTYQLYRSGATCLHAALDIFGNQLSTWYQPRNAMCGPAVPPRRRQ